MSDDQANTKGIDALLKALKNPAMIRIGILGKGARADGKATNALIGACHEFGTSRLPERSFLRVPLADHFEKRLKAAGAFDKEVMLKVLKTGSLRPWMQQAAIVAEAIVQDAFDTGGFGKWPASDMSRKKNHQTLVETQQLRNSITSEVKDS